MVDIGQTLVIKKGPFKDFEATIIAIENHVLVVEVDAFGRKIPIELKHSDFGLPYLPEYQELEALITEFDTLYRQAAPQRYALLQEGLGLDAEKICRHTIPVHELPQDFFHLYAWKNGMLSPFEGWKNEFSDDSWYELPPLDSCDHFLSLEGIAASIAMWEDILQAKRQQGKVCYWKPGFIPFLAAQHYGLSVIDTVGYFGGQPFQVVFFDYKCANGYTVIHENLSKWLETCVVLLRQGLLFARYDTDIIDIKAQINGYYTDRFPSCIPLG